jgi:hypothetical protein
VVDTSSIRLIIAADIGHFDALGVARFFTHSIVGRVLYTLIDYMGRPTGMELVAYCGTILAMLTLMQTAAIPARQRRAPAASAIL